MSDSSSTLERVKQTHRTILFEEFSDPSDDSALNLYTMLSSAVDDSSITHDELMADIAKLEVRSFEEFIKGKKIGDKLFRFVPPIYEYYQGTSDGRNTYFNYTTNANIAQQNNAVEKTITDNTYYQMLVNLYLQKGERGLANIEFDDKKIREILTPKREIEEINDIRKQLIFLQTKCDECRKNNENANDYKRRFNNYRKRIIMKYKDSKLPLVINAIAQVNQQIDIVDDKLKKLKAVQGSDGGEMPQLVSGSFVFDEDGHIAIQPLSSGEVGTNQKGLAPGVQAKLEARQKITQAIGRDFDKYAGENTNQFTKDLVLHAYTPPLPTEESPYDAMNAIQLQNELTTLKHKKKYYEEIYCKAKEAFISKLSEVVLKVLGVKIFFDHATINRSDTEKLPQAGLLVANCKANKLVDDKVKAKFKEVMERLGKQETGEKKIWFGILPHVLGERQEAADDLDGDDIVLPDEEQPEANYERKQSDGTDLNAAISLLKIMDECKILTVFNFIPDKTNTFGGISAQSIRDVKEKLRVLIDNGNGHAVYAYPNFMLMKEGEVKVDDRKVDDREDVAKIQVPAAYIDAAYVAAGLLVASQQPQFLQEHGFKSRILNDNVCVRVDLEKNNVPDKLLTHFNRELAYVWPKEIKKAIFEDHFGFVFCSDAKFDQIQGKYLDHSYILSARTLRKITINNHSVYQPIFWTLTKDFCLSFLKTYSGGEHVTTEAINNFLQDVDAWTEQAKMERREKNEIVNFILREGENVIWDPKDKLIVVKFNEGEDSFEVDVVADNVQGGNKDE